MAENTPREIANLGALDLTGMKSPEELDSISRIVNVGAIIVPESLMAKLMAIPQVNVGATLPIPDGKVVKVNTVMGPFQTSGEGLAAPGSGGEGEAEHILSVMGPVIVTSPIEKVGYTAISVMGPVMAPKGSELALASSNFKVMGPISFYPAGAVLKAQYGDVQMSGNTLGAAQEDGVDTLVVMGSFFVTSPVPKSSFKRLYVMGQMMAPKESKDVLEPLLEVLGQVAWYTGTPRVFNGDERLSAEFFELLKEPITIIINGELVIEPDVTKELLKSKVTEIILNGTLAGPKDLIPLLQVLTTEKNGSIEVEGAGDSGKDANDA